MTMQVNGPRGGPVADPTQPVWHLKLVPAAARPRGRSWAKRSDPTADRQASEAASRAANRGESALAASRDR